MGVRGVASLLLLLQLSVTLLPTLTTVAAAKKERLPAKSLWANGPISPEETKLLEKLQTKAFARLQTGDMDGARRAFQKMERIDPWNVNALLQLGRLDIERLEDKPHLAGRAATRLYRAFDDRASPGPAPITAPDQIGVVLGTWAANHAAKELQDYRNATKLLRPLAQLAWSDHLPSDCVLIQAATLVVPYPDSSEGAVEMLEMSRLFTQAAMNKKTKLRVDPTGEDITKDYYNACLLTGFWFAAFYEADVKARLGERYQLTQRAWPELGYVAPHLRLITPGPAAAAVAAAAASASACGAQGDPGSKECRGGAGGRRLRVGFATAFFSPANSVLTDFGGVLLRLDPSQFDVSFIYINEVGASGDPPFIASAKNKFTTDPETGDVRPRYTVIEVAKQDGWLKEGRLRIAALELDLLVWLDATMSTISQRLAMSRLAAVQANSHGHPLTSGIDPSVQDYFISWGAAEIPTAYNHYTERLVLLPEDAPHQYWSARSEHDPEAVEITDIMSIDDETGEHLAIWKDLTRAHFATAIRAPPDAHWYVCMQKPYKNHPIFDDMLASIQVRECLHARRRRSCTTHNSAQGVAATLRRHATTPPPLRSDNL